MLKDSGDRREFESGAVRDMHSGKGRCDLLPLDVVGRLLRCPRDVVLNHIETFTVCGDPSVLMQAVRAFISDRYYTTSNRQGDIPTALLELAIHFEDGAVKYGDNNWRKGVPANVYIDSGIRHYLKWMRGDDDEPHDRAVLWNLICCIWTCEHLPELNVYLKKDGVERGM